MIKIYLMPVLATLLLHVFVAISYAETATFTYDKLNRLTSAKYGQRKISYSYDSAGNLTHVNTSYSVTVGVNGTGGTVVTNVQGLDCTSNCQWVLGLNDTLTLQAVPSDSHIFTGWAGACAGYGPCVITVNSTANIRAGFAYTAIPLKLSYQGYLTTDAGQPVSGQIDTIFSIYDSQAAQLWTESHGGVTINSGLYSVSLGSLTPLNVLPFNEQYFFGIKIGSDAETEPKLPFTGFVNSLRSATTDSFTSGVILTGDIPNEAITLDKLSNDCSEGQVLRQTAAGWVCGVAP